jgi:hypothetical protein
MSGSGKNASGQEAFGSKIKETLVVESPAAAAVDVTSTAGGAGTTAVSEADKAGTSTTLAVEDEGGDLCTTVPQPTADPQVAKAGGARAEDDLHRCLYVGTRGRRRSSPTAAMWKNSRRRYARLDACCQ